METKDFRNALLANIKNELKDFTLIQRNLKKSRKLEFRPKDKSLQSICDEINRNAYKISYLIFYYRWIKHSLKYWAKRDINDFWDYYSSTENQNSHYTSSIRNDKPYWAKGKTYEEYEMSEAESYYKEKAEQYGLELPEDLSILITNK